MNSLTVLLSLVVGRAVLSGTISEAREMINVAGLAAMIIVCSWILVTKRRAPSFPRHPILLFPIYLILCVPTLLLSNPVLDLSAVRDETLRAAAYTLVFVSVTVRSASLSSEGHARFMRSAAVLVGAFLFLYAWFGIYQYFSGAAYVVEAGWGPEAREHRLAIGLAVNPNAFATTLLLGGLGVLAAPRPALRPWLRVVLGVSIALAILLTGSRLALLSLVLGCSLIFWRRAKVSGLVALIVAGAIALTFLESFDIAAKGTSSILWRYLTWTELLEGLQGWEFVFGAGPGEVARYLRLNSYLDVVEPHNDYVRMLYTFGLGGFLYYTVAWRPAFRHKTWRSQYAGLDAVAVAFLAVSVGENVYNDSNATLFALVWLAVRYSATRKVQTPATAAIGGLDGEPVTAASNSAGRGFAL